MCSIVKSPQQITGALPETFDPKKESVCVCACVSVRERERESVCVCVREREMDRAVSGEDAEDDVGELRHITHHLRQVHLERGLCWNPKGPLLECMLPKRLGARWTNGAVEYGRGNEDRAPSLLLFQPLVGRDSRALLENLTQRLHTARI